jgi:hypothetical protein
LPLIALLGALELGASVYPSLALPEGTEVVGVRHAAFEPIARKGTRNYAPGEETAPQDTTTDATASPEKPDAAAEAKALQDCIAIWDEKTHITQAHWKDICKRQLKERGAQLH